ncbi:elongation factor G [Oribacterium sp. oral taxon 102]|uniref:elongation factor G n=1 Tax=Oribacterium sp. oral taxon 102 TaxID=671214 RepID=UPI0015BFB07F|nr:elongation factor G [Oribacterium sp. oral taxon 102]NWO21608.1 elongation factor G [Oribacterium sp. oral taxon 102]
MKVYDTGAIRNVVLLGHGGAGKTTVAEALMFVTGGISRMGSVPDGTTVSDYDKEEKKRHFSISASVLPIEYKGESGDIKVNILDTPGYFDFIGEVEEAVSAADAAVIVVNCKAGIEPGTVKAWEICERFRIPRLFFVSNMDDDHASYRQLVLDLEKRFGRAVAPFQLPIRENEKFVGFVNVIKMAGRRFTKLNEYEPCEIPDYVEKNLGIARSALLEAVAETSDEYMEKYFSGEEFTVDEIQTALRENVKTCSVVPVLMGSGTNIQGFNVLLQIIEKYFPAPNEFETVGVDASTGERFTAKYNSEVSLSAKVWKTIADPFMGKYSLVKICTGTMKPNSEIYNSKKETIEKVGKVYLLRGGDSIEVPELRAGDIGAVAKLAVTETGDSIAVRTAPVLYHGPQLSTPYTYMAYRAENKADEDKLSTALQRMMEEDKTLKTVADPENRQSLLYAIGEQQLEVTASMLKERYNVSIVLSKPKFAYRETLKKTVKVQGRYKKQSGGHGQYGDVIMEFAPSGDNETPYIFEEKVFGGAVPKNFFPAVEKGIQESCKKGPLAGYPVVGVRATLLDGSYHPVDSSEQAFKTAASIAFKDGFMKAQPVLLEPIASLKVTAPDSNTGDIMGDLTKRRGRVLGMTALHDGKQMIEAELPMSNLYGYNTDLRSMTGGAGSYEYAFVRYEQAPGDIQNQIVAEAAANKAQD